MVCFKPKGGCRSGHQKGGGHAFASYVGNDDLHGMRVNGEVVIVIAANAPCWLHHAGCFESSNRWFTQGKKQALDLRGQLEILEKIIPLLLNGLGERFPLLDISLDHINNKRRSPP